MIDPMDPLYAQAFSSQLSKADRMRYSIIRGALPEIAKNGLDPALFGLVAERLGVRRSHISYYFETREELLLAAVKYSIANMQKSSVDLVQRETTADGRFRAMIEGGIRWGREFPEQARVFLLFHFYAASDPRFSEVSLALRASGQERVAAILAELAPKTPRAELLALGHEIYASFMGLLIEWFASGRPQDAKKYGAAGEALALRYLSTLKTSRRKSTV
jgi:AcrR family transcriptional regulator